MTLAGIDARELDIERLANAIYALIASDVDGFVDRSKVRRQLDDRLALLGRERDPATWGKDPRAQAALRAAERLGGRR